MATIHFTPDGKLGRRGVLEVKYIFTRSQITFVALSRARPESEVGGRLVVFLFLCAHFLLLLWFSISGGWPEISLDRWAFSLFSVSPVLVFWFSNFVFLVFFYFPLDIFFLLITNLFQIFTKIPQLSIELRNVTCHLLNLSN